MSSSYSAWFRKGPDPGTIITLDQPVPSRWKILEKLNEHDYQVNEEENDEYGFRSFASAKYLCCNPISRTKNAFMRIYIQVPHRKTELDDADTRSRQATTYNPPELIAYRDLTEKGSSDTPKLLGYKIDKQDRSGLVPGGFIIWLVWEIVPGLRLGDGNGADPFWALESDEREQVRLAFLRAIAYFIGPFEKAGKPERPIMFGANWIAHFDLAKPDPSTDERDSDWDKDTSCWQW
ncbi:hypothetical protein PEX1_059140 [Penicillium expansum]|uniref:Uncharacterized protein n=1 Tax=Penicillium expansum TaxID=27334 RepID=A0A0A2IKF4_PENEN|nr:hypothetical protein PEX2_083260 [Penicillium expansum]KGO43582.1 hypothetical protein PEXP_094840 [Penicillium expansum]KGO52792.1 hypothetical protein PEX2_083260 [Penicillium expansum]KGO70542.1 hypothetical protein PEX1_059140 [Penicillium expansum]UPX44730.1 hypothetical protein FAC1L15_06 [Penicillium camemberti]